MLIHAGIIRSPYLISLPFLLPLAVMCWELGADVVRAAQLAEQLRTNRDALQISDQRFRLVVEAAPSAMVMMDWEGRIELVNAQAEAVFGFPRAELIGKSIDVLVPQRLRARLSGLRKRCAQQSQIAGESGAVSAGRDFYVCRKNGTELPAEV